MHDMRFPFTSSLLLFLTATSLFAQDNQRGFALFPQHRLFDKLLADPQEVQLTARLLTRRQQFAGNIGYSVGLFAITNPQWQVQLRVEGNTLLVSKVRTPDFPVQSTDFTIGLPIEFRHKQFSGKVRVAHISSHLGDNFNGIEDVETAIDAFGDGETYFSVPKKFSKEYMEVLGALQLHGLRVYAGGVWDFHMVTNTSDTEDRSVLTLHYGVEHLFYGRRRFTRPYVAMDIRQQQEFNWHADFNLQAGLAIQNQHLRGMRIAVELYRGHSVQGQFFRRLENDVNLLLTFDF